MRNQASSILDSCSSASIPSVASTSRSSTGSSSGLLALAAASTELKDQLSKPSLKVLSSWVLAPDSLFRAKCPECGYIPAPTLGALSQHMVQNHPEVSEPPRTCYKCGIKVSPIDVEKHFQNHGNVLAQQISKFKNSDDYSAPVQLNIKRRALLSQPMPWHGPRAYRPSSGPQVYRSPPGPHLYRPPSDPPQGYTGPPNAPLGHSVGPPAPWPGEWNQPPPGYWPSQPPGPSWRY